MNKKNEKKYRWCAVPECGNSSLKTPNKLFLFVPREKTIRDKWLELVRRDATAKLPSKHLYFCEDHFDLPNDMENYMEYHLMGSVSQIRMKPGCVPMFGAKKLQCQSDRRKRTSSATETEQQFVKKLRKTLIEECEKDLEERTAATKQAELGETSSENSVSQACVENISQEDANKMADKSVQVHMKCYYRSKGTQTKKKPISKPFMIEEENDTDIRHRESSSPSARQIKSSSNCTELIDEDKKQEAMMKNPHYYFGVPKSCYYLIELIEKITSIPAKHILLCLNKIRFNSPFAELANFFSMTTSYTSKLFRKNIPVIANLMRPFIVELDNDSIKIDLPVAFRHKYQNVCCIIDCLEIEVEKPSEALKQSLSWSENKKAHTIKYLLSCTPHGLVNYVSPGYGGRITDTCLVESCDFTKCLQPGMCVMADRGFKHVEQYLRKEGVQLVRPPSVTTLAKLSKSEARVANHIASLRKHVKRRLREFNMLDAHACVNHDFVKLLDDVITIACGLINLQRSLVK